jgi:uncharacterized membrane protein YfcA
MSETEILSLPIIAFLAFFLKGIAGIGVSTVAVPILSLIIGAKQIVVLSSIVNVIGGLVMYRIDPQPVSRRYWCPIAALMIVGAVLGGIALKLTPLKSFEKMLGFAILAAGIWFIIWRGKRLYFGSYLAKGPMRRLLVLILLPSAVIQVVTYSALGLMNRQILLYALFALPGLLLGIYFGNRTFFRISERVFGVVLGGVLILLSWGLIL